MFLLFGLSAGGRCVKDGRLAARGTECRGMCKKKGWGYNGDMEMDSAAMARRALPSYVSSAFPYPFSLRRRHRIAKDAHTFSVSCKVWR